MLSKITEDDRFKSPFSQAIFKVRKIYTNTVLMEDVKDKNHEVITEIATIASFYQKVDEQQPIP